MKALGGIAVVAGLLAASGAMAASADCLLEVKGVRYIDGPCRMTFQKPVLPNDIPGSFQIYTQSYFAQIDVTAPGKADGFWNEEKGANHAHSKLGQLAARGACWENAIAKACAWKLGERRRTGFDR